MNKLILSLVCFLFSNAISAQLLIKDYIQNNASAVRSIQINDTDFSDLKVFDKAIGNAQVVMLGEQDHGDAAAFEAKARLIKYLHEQKGFDVLAFESDFYSLSKGWIKVAKGELSLSSHIEQNIFPIWTRCQQTSVVFNYIIDCFASPKPLILTGFDNQLVMPYSQQNFKKELDLFLVPLNLPFVNSSTYKAVFLPLVESVLDPKKHATIAKDLQSLESTIAQTDTILSQLKSKGMQQSFWYPALQSFKAHCQQVLYGGQNDFSASMQVRDQQMAQNLAWLAQVKYPNKKIIVWAASYHIIKNKLEHLRHLTMGYYFTQQPQLAKRTYTLGFASYAGSAGAVHAKPYDFSSSQPESLEEWMNEKQYAFAFVDFNAFNKKHPQYSEAFYMGGIRHLQQKADWTVSYDGVFYIRNMYPCSIKE